MADSNNTINININAKDNTKAATSSAMKNFANMREMGEKISQIGTRLSAAFTLPLVGLSALLMKNEQFAASLQPIREALARIINDLAITLIPVIKDLTPMILGLIRSLDGLLKKFAGLTTEQKENILKWVGFAALLGPIIFGVGQLTSFIGTLGVVFGGAAAGVWAFVAPVVALAGAIFAVIKLTQMEEFKQLASLLIGGAVGASTGNMQLRNAAVANTYKNLGGGGDTSTGDMIRGLVSGPAKGNTAAPVVINYSPALSTASKQELEKNLGPVIADILRQQQGRK